MTDPDSKPIGPILDELGMTMTVRDRDRVTEVLLLAKIVDLEDGQPILVLESNGLDWIQMEGLMGAALQVMRRSEPEERE